MYEGNNNQFNYGPQGTPPQQYPPQYPPYSPYPQYPQYQYVPVTPPVIDPEQVARDEEKRSIKKAALWIGLPCLALSAIGIIFSLLVQISLTYIEKYTNVTAEQALEFLQNPAIQQVTQILLSSLMFLVPFSIAAKASKHKISTLISFKKVEKGKILPYLFFGMGFCAFAQIASSYISSLIESFGFEYNVYFGENPKGIYGFLLSFIATAIVPALVEEFACRGVILGLLKKHGEGFAILVSAIVFGVMHGNFQQIPFATIVGLILGYIYIKTNSIWICVAVHGINNAVSVIMSYLDGVLSVNLQNVVYMSYLISCLLLSGIGVLLLVKNNAADFALKKVEGKLTGKQKFRVFFLYWAILVFLIINIVEALSYFNINIMDFIYSFIYQALGSAGV